jgi:PhnB protein
MQVNPYLTFSGNCEAAFKFYERCLGGKIEAMVTHEGTPMENQVPPAWRKKIMHVRLSVGDTVLMGSDGPPDSKSEIKGFSVSVTLKDTAQAERTFKALAEKGTIQMPIQGTFWSPRFGMLVDQFGVPWMINCEPAA